jgi:DNA-binding response OmpR family regulator
MTRVLLVEDDSIIQSIYQQVLECVSCKVGDVVQVNTRQLERDFSTVQNCDVVVLNLGLRDMMGEELIRKIRKVPDVDVIHATGDNELFKKDLNKALGRSMGNAK